MTLPHLNLTTGLLPLGRFGASLHEIQAAFVDDTAFSASSTRPEIWSHFESATTELRRIVPVSYAWIGGSFTTSKMDPDDIDVVYWAEDKKIHAVSDPQDAFVLEMFARNEVRSSTGLRVDSRVCHWHVQPATGVQATFEHNNYVKHRGFWDDFWLRKRVGLKTDPPTRADALPQRGYFEVELDGFDVL
jgi:hypothetical protein